ncbi:leucyl aminopeptidase [Streptacidiphilus carbonis]|uniref:leucyl aminopeptidase n=1 Tax=Streptacidiphilus carbonis TaxID=105422 RepID=UPI0005A9498D|nr:leucyl aminopeptidase [Streptacidiphilus carbonis]
MADIGDVMDLVPSWKRQVGVSAAVLPGERVDAVAVGEVLGVPVAAPVADQDWLGLSSAGLRAAGMDGSVGRTLACPVPGGGLAVLYGVGAVEDADARALRDAGAALAAAAKDYSRIALVVPEGTTGADAAETAAQALVEGVVLARYGYPVLKRPTADPELESLVLLAAEARLPAVAQGAERGRVLARTQSLARDLATCPPSIMTAEVLARIAPRLAADCGFTAEVFDRAQLRQLGCGGLLGVNAGSTDEPRMIKVSYAPSDRQAASLALVGKGIMYDSGGISLKPSDAVHATMKNDMSGAGAILAAMTALAALACPTAVTGWLMCTDNMPSGSATKLGDVLTIRGGSTVEVLNTDAEGRLVMADALVLATEEPCDAIVDIATLTGASMRALGAEIAGLFGNDQPLVDQVLAAARHTDEPCWQLPLARRYRAELDSDVADIKNMGGPNGGAIHAALFLEEFVGERPWAHIDIAGPAQNDSPKSWRPRGCTGFGARLLTRLALDFSKPKPKP